MAKDLGLSGLSPTVLKVIDEFTAACRVDGDIDNGAAARLEKLLKQASIPNPDDISTALFEPPKGGPE